MPFGWETFLWVKPLKKSEKHRLRKELLREGYNANEIKHMDIYLKKKLWKMFKERI